MATPKMATAGPLDKGQPSDYMRDQAQRNYNRPDFRTVAAAALASQRDFAARLGMVEGSVSNYIKGRRLIRYPQVGC